MRSRYEVKAQKELESEGYIVDYKIRPSRLFRGQQIDFFGRFDLLAVKRGFPVRWISIKGHAGVPKLHQEEVKKFWLPEGNIKEIWQHPKRKKKQKSYWVKKVL